MASGETHTSVCSQCIHNCKSLIWIWWTLPAAQSEAPQSQPPQSVSAAPIISPSEVYFLTAFLTGYLQETFSCQQLKKKHGKVICSTLDSVSKVSCDLQDWKLNFHLQWLCARFLQINNHLQNSCLPQILQPLQFPQCPSLHHLSYQDLLHRFLHLMLDLSLHQCNLCLRVPQCQYLQVRQLPSQSRSLLDSLHQLRPLL